MERLQDRLRHWMDGKTVRVQRRNVAAAIFVLCLVAVLGSFLGRNPISITLGSLSGLGMALLLRHGFSLLTPGMQHRWNLKARYRFTQRRWLVALMTALLVTTLIAYGKFLPYALGGAITVCAFILLALLFLPTAEELARMEQQAQETAEANEKATATADWDGLDDQGLPTAGPDLQG